MSERFSDEVLQQAMKAQHDGFVNGDSGTNAERRQAGYAAMRAVLEGHLACQWRERERDHYETSCGRFWFSTGPGDTAYCGGCGGRIERAGAAADGSPR